MQVGWYAALVRKQYLNFSSTLPYRLNKLQPIPISDITLEGVRVYIARDDLNHPLISGNKLHKLKPGLKLALEQNVPMMVSFGGPYSNHLHAMAYATKMASVQSIGIVRGELHHNLTPTLMDCEHWGMKLIPCPRERYRQIQDSFSRHSGLYRVHQVTLMEDFNLPPGGLILPEGGSSDLSVKSVSDAYSSLFENQSHDRFTHAFCATGTGATLAGLLLAAPSEVRVIGVQMVAEGDATLNRVRNWTPNSFKEPEIISGHLGGFAKKTPELMAFIDNFEAQHKIQLDPIYTGKLLFRIHQMILNGELSEKDKPLLIHTGGLQGKRQ